jgi:predicted nucleotidyltransferase
MPRNTITDVFASSNVLIVLSFLAEHAGEEFLSSEIRQATKLSRAGVYLAGRDLVAKNLVSRIEKGRFHLYSVKPDHPIVRQFKILKNIAALESLLEKMRPAAQKIVLFGSAARGEDLASSDIDIFFLTLVPEKIRSLLASYTGARKIQSIVLAPSEWSEFKDREPVFVEEIERGIALWEVRDESGLHRMPEEREDQRIFPRKKPRS